MVTVGEYLHTCKLKLSTTKAVLAVFHLNNKEAKCGLEAKDLGVALNKRRSRITDNWLGCWSNNVANSHLSPAPFNNRVPSLLSGAAMLTPASLTLPPTTPCEL